MKGRYVEIDISEVEAYRERVEKAGQDFDKRVEQFLIKMAYLTNDRIKLLTPTDTGKLRDRWTVQDARRRGNDIIVYIVNPQEYASFVEDGHRQKARWLPGEFRNGKFKYIKGHNKGIKLKTKFIPGVHMVRLSLEQLERDIPAHWKKFLDKFIANFDL